MFSIADGDRQIGVPRQVVERQDRVQQRLRLAAEEPVAPVVERVAELDRAGDRLERPGRRVEPEVVAARRDRPAPSGRRRGGPCRRCPTVAP